MKEIHIVVRPQLLERVHEALRACPGFPGMTVGEVDAYPPVASQAGAHSIKEDLTEFVPRVRIEIVREAIAEPGNPKRAKARPATDAPLRTGPDLKARIAAT